LETQEQACESVCIPKLVINNRALDVLGKKPRALTPLYYRFYRDGTNLFGKPKENSKRRSCFLFATELTLQLPTFGLSLESNAPFFKGD
jgi:hypothetical protein